MRYYVYTMPKAGTYLLAEFLQQIGLINTGRHVELGRFLDTKSFDLETNTTNPASTIVDRPFIRTLEDLADGEMAFGHLPVPLCSWALPNMKFVCSYRNPKYTLVSEFIDFRFRRVDIGWISKYNVQDDREAFLLYLKNRGSAHKNHLSEMLAARMIYNNGFFTEFNCQNAIFVNFDSFLASDKDAITVGRFLGYDASVSARAWAGALAAETKTKATGLPVPRGSLWTREALNMLNELGFQYLIDKGSRLGLHF